MWWKNVYDGEAVWNISRVWQTDRRTECHSTYHARLWKEVQILLQLHKSSENNSSTCLSNDRPIQYSLWESAETNDFSCSCAWHGYTASRRWSLGAATAHQREYEKHGGHYSAQGASNLERGSKRVCVYVICVSVGDCHACYQQQTCTNASAKRIYIVFRKNSHFCFIA